MNFNQGFGSSQGFGFGFQQGQQGDQWQTQQSSMQREQQQQMLQWPSTGQGQMQGFFNANSDSRQASDLGWQGANQQMNFQNMPRAYQGNAQPLQSHPNQQMQGSMIAQGQEQFKKHQFEEQKRKLREMSSRGVKPIQKDGKNMLDDFMSKTDLNLSSGLKQTSVHNDQSRPTSIFTGKSRLDANLQQPHQSQFSQNQAFGQSQSEPLFSHSQPGFDYAQPGMDQSKPGLSQSQYGLSFLQPGLEPSQPGLDQSKSGLNQLQRGLNYSQSGPSQSQSETIQWQSGLIQSQSGPSYSQSGFTHPLPETSRSESGLSYSQPGPSQWQSGPGHLQQSQFGQTTHYPQHQHHPHSSQQRSKSIEDDFGDFQGGNVEAKQEEQGFNSLNSSTSSLSSLKSSSSAGFQGAILTDHEKALSSGSDSSRSFQPTFSSQAGYTNVGQQFPVAPQITAFKPQETDSQLHRMEVQRLGQTRGQTSQSSGTSDLHSAAASFQTVHAFSSAPAGFLSHGVSSSVDQMLSDPSLNPTPLNMISDPIQDDHDDGDKEELLYGSTLPTWCHDPALLPSVYKRVLEKSMALDGAIDTDKVYSILLASNVPKDRLRDIWAMANMRNPGMLVEEELYLVLGFVALAQAGWTKLSIKKLSSCITAPIPEFPEYVLVDPESGSVFGGDSLIVENNLRSSSPADPEDKYSVFRSHNRDTSPPIALSTSTSNATASVSGSLNASFTGGLTSDGTVNSATKAEAQRDTTVSAEGWADFQSSNAPSAPSSSVDAASLENTAAASFFSSSASTSTVQSVPNLTKNSSIITQTPSGTHSLDAVQTAPSFASTMFTTPSVSVSSNDVADFVSAQSFSMGPESSTEMPKTQSAANKNVHDDFSEFSSVTAESSTSNDNKFNVEQLTAEHRLAKNTGPGFDTKYQNTQTFTTGMDKVISLDESWDEFASFSPVLGTDIQSSKNNFGAINIESTAGTLSMDDLSLQTDTKASSMSISKDVDLVKNQVKQEAVNENAEIFSAFSASAPKDDLFDLGRDVALSADGPKFLAKEKFDVTDDRKQGLFSSPANESPEASNDSQGFANFAQLNDFENLSADNVGTSNNEFADFSSCSSSFASEKVNGRSADANDQFLNLTGTESKYDKNEEERVHAASSMFHVADKNNIDAFADFGEPETSGGSHFSGSVATAANIQCALSQNKDPDDFAEFGSFKGKDDAFAQMEVSSNVTEASALKRPLDMDKQLNLFSSATSNFNSGSASQINVLKVESREVKTVDGKSSSGAYADSALNAKDRYRALTGVLEDSELHVHEWKRCFNGIKKVFESTTEMMKQHNLSLATKKEVFESERGKEFFNGLKEVFAVACRLKVSIEKSALAKSNEDLKVVINEVDKLWREVCGFASGLPEHKALE